MRRFGNLQKVAALLFRMAISTLNT